ILADSAGPQICAKAAAIPASGRQEGMVPSVPLGAPFLEGNMTLRNWRALVLAAALLPSAAVMTTVAEARQAVEVAFVLDTTGSMGPLIEGAKRKIWSIATAILDANP